MILSARKAGTVSVEMERIHIHAMPKREEKSLRRRVPWIMTESRSPCVCEANKLDITGRSRSLKAPSSAPAPLAVASRLS